MDTTLWSIYTNPASLLFYKKYQDAFQKKEVVHFEEYLTDIDVWLDISAYPFNEGVTIYFEDITQQKNQAMELKQARENQSALVNSTIDLIWSVDKELKLISFYKAYYDRILRVTGKPPY